MIDRVLDSTPRARALISVRWLQLPLLVGLLVALVIFEIKFAKHLYAMIMQFETLSRKQTILLTLDLIDMVLIADLIIMVVISTYKKLITPLNIKDVYAKTGSDSPRYLREYSSGQVKSRIATTILLIATIQLLHMYLDSTVISQERMIFIVAAQIMFAITALLFVFMNHYGYKHTHKND